MDYKITPYESLGNIPLGLHRDEIRNLLKETPHEFYRNFLSKTPTDFFKTLGLFIGYDENLLCEAIEMILPANPILFTIELLILPYESIEDQIAKWDDKLEKTNTGFTSYKFGVGVYAPNKDDSPNEITESVIIFKKGYYD
ncbi:hypothetical protein SAMN05192574_102828 [Mucilaginibacter gossypiicola]|uniref:Uncharacterized protein n=1 Tax=Mucilaginibacter gossypiicola TaxID=551995 RepID=A0A1H8ESY4_9SPHI|nr:hypothetical protein [Mucilaginibacter gossypiicola]SEN22486.1 hypothetical protein SAMN05192574_102828 [Mucilaginibacter gossypiicola]